MYIRNESSHIMIFSTAANLQRLAASRYWLVDGTFATAPLEFTQMYSIHGSVGYEDYEAVVPLVFMLLNNKTQETYTCAFEALLEVCQDAQIQLNPKFIISDFEKAVINVLKDIFPEAECFLCYFHFAQNLIKQLSFRGLKTLYSNETDVYMAVKRLQALPFLPHSRIAGAFDRIKTNMPEKLSGFLEYFKATYVSGRNNNNRPIFHPALWSNNRAVLQRLPLTTNALEAWHRRWTVVVGSGHLSITRIITELRTEQVEIEGKIIRILQGNVPQASRTVMDKIKDICSKSDVITDDDFVESIALLLSSRPKRV